MNISRENISQEAETVFVGIDVHKKKYSVVAMISNAVIKKWTAVADPEALTKQILRYFSGRKIYSAYEAGFSGFVLHRLLTQAGITNLVVHAAAIEVLHRTG